MKRRSKKRYFLLLFILVIGLLFIKSDWMGRWMYPIRYMEDIRASASNYNIDPHLVAAIIRAETNFSTGAESAKGALGLMQIMPETADWIMEKAGFTGITKEMLRHRADVSIELGSWYLGSLHKQFNGNSVAVVAAYNAGPGNVSKWLNNGQWDGKLENISQVPFGETRHYVQRVFYYYNKYKDFYPKFE